MVTRTRESLKRQHERAVCDNLLQTLNIDASFQRLGDDKQEPDVIYKIHDRTIGIEVATAYYDDSDAKQTWTLAAGEREFPKEGYEPRAAGLLVNPDDTICEKVQGELDDKCKKTYTGVDDVWLCIALDAPLSDAKSLQNCAETLTIPDNHRFAAIYVVYQAPLHEGGGFTVLKIG